MLRLKAKLGGFALLMVLAFLMILGLLMAPLFTAVGQISSATISLETVPAREEAKAAAVNLVRFLIADSVNSAVSCPGGSLTGTEIALPQGRLNVTSLRCYDRIETISGDAFRYWSFESTFEYNLRGQSLTYTYTGSAVQFVMGTNDQLDDYVYITDFEEGR
ncbi:hypothetical protein HPY42_01155 [Coprothermobacteraceae bacterium]|nr:hypothetical protein [Coprothermobacteraceae bacterium]